MKKFRIVIFILIPILFLALILIPKNVYAYSPYDNERDIKVIDKMTTYNVSQIVYDDSSSYGSILVNNRYHALTNNQWGYVITWAYVSMSFNEIWDTKSFYITDSAITPNNIISTISFGDWTDNSFPTNNMYLLYNSSSADYQNPLIDITIDNLHGVYKIDDAIGTLDNQQSTLHIIMIETRQNTLLTTTEKENQVRQLVNNMYLSYDTYEELKTRQYDYMYGSGYEQAFQSGKQSGKSEGLIEGYSNGRADYGIYYNDQWTTAQTYGNIMYNLGQSDDTDFFGVILGGLFSFIGAIGGIELLPNLRIWHLVAVPLVFGILYFILGKRGGDE